jgi:GTP-binding protein
LDTLPPEPEQESEELPEITPVADEKTFQVYQLADDKWLVEGVAIERAAQMTNWNYYEAAMRFQRILQAMGIAEALRTAGVREGDTVRIGEAELVWGYENAFGE